MPEEDAVIRIDADFGPSEDSLRDFVEEAGRMEVELPVSTKPGTAQKQPQAQQQVEQFFKLLTGQTVKRPERAGAAGADPLAEMNRHVRQIVSSIDQSLNELRNIGRLLERQRIEKPAAGGAQGVFGGVLAGEVLGGVAAGAIISEGVKGAGGGLDPVAAGKELATQVNRNFSDSFDFASLDEFVTGFESALGDMTGAVITFTETEIRTTKGLVLALQGATEAFQQVRLGGLPTTAQGELDVDMANVGALMVNQFKEAIEPLLAINTDTDRTAIEIRQRLFRVHDTLAEVEAQFQAGLVILTSIEGSATLSESHLKEITDILRGGGFGPGVGADLPDTPPVPSEEDLRALLGGTDASVDIPKPPIDDAAKKALGGEGASISEFAAKLAEDLDQLDTRIKESIEDLTTINIDIEPEIAPAMDVFLAMSEALDRLHDSTLAEAQDFIHLSNALWSAREKLGAFTDELDLNQGIPQGMAENLRAFGVELELLEASVKDAADSVRDKMTAPLDKPVDPDVAAAFIEKHKPDEEAEDQAADSLASNLAELGKEVARIASDFQDVEFFNAFISFTESADQFADEFKSVMSLINDAISDVVDDLEDSAATISRDEAELLPVDLDAIKDAIAQIMSAVSTAGPEGVVLADTIKPIFDDLTQAVIELVTAIGGSADSAGPLAQEALDAARSLGAAVESAAAVADVPAEQTQASLGGAGSPPVGPPPAVAGAGEFGDEILNALKDISQNAATAIDKLGVIGGIAIDIREVLSSINESTAALGSLTVDTGGDSEDVVAAIGSLQGTVAEGQSELSEAIDGFAAESRRAAASGRAGGAASTGFLAGLFGGGVGSLLKRFVPILGAGVALKFMFDQLTKSATDLSDGFEEQATTFAQVNAPIALGLAELEMSQFIAEMQAANLVQVEFRRSLMESAKLIRSSATIDALAADARRELMEEEFRRLREALTREDITSFTQFGTDLMLGAEIFFTSIFSDDMRSLLVSGITGAVDDMWSSVATDWKDAWSKLFSGDIFGSFKASILVTLETLGALFSTAIASVLLVATEVVGGILSFLGVTPAEDERPLGGRFQSPKSLEDLRAKAAGQDAGLTDSKLLDKFYPIPKAADFPVHPGKSLDQESMTRAVEDGVTRANSKDQPFSVIPPELEAMFRSELASTFSEQLA